MQQKYYSEMNSKRILHEILWRNIENYALAQLYAPAAPGVEIVFINSRKCETCHATDNKDFTLLLILVLDGIIKDKCVLHLVDNLRIRI